MNVPNENIPFYKGSFQIKGDGMEVTIDGEINFHWFPNIVLRFTGTPHEDFANLFNLFSSNTASHLYINDHKVGLCQITSLSSFTSGIISGKAFLGDKSISVSKINFSIPNFLDIHGSLTKRITPEKAHVTSSRITLENNDYLFIIDKCYNYNDTKDLLKTNGGYILQYSGELTSKKGNINLEEARKAFSCLNKFLTFLNGRRTSALFIHGVYNEETIWSDFTPYLVDQYKSSFRWLPIDSSKKINLIWNRFSLLWQEVNSRDFLSTAIHWYIEVNNNTGFTTGSIVTAQIALELLYNWTIVENKKLLIGKDAENITAANKIRLLISFVGLDYEVPPAFKGLQEFIKNDKNLKDGPDAVVRIRNYIVHSQEDKRKILHLIPNKVLHEALQLSIWYIEMSLLFILGYKGEYHNRCSEAQYIGDTETVPWASK
ncbi:hypothetical protein EFA69_17585 [Rufibacter immobilis]|uniref:YopA central domain-containing protein n=2 Tax=Rufibacter immobilis TaxID=1348778 RepID=A0A3M9MQS8_9BACT|nr:hypothetical protein EFA69_17585 [Rufibacter immobilis]